MKLAIAGAGAGSAGLTDLESRTANGSFLGCHIAAQPNPFVLGPAELLTNVATGRA